MAIIPAQPAGGFEYEIPAREISPLETFATVLGGAMKGRREREKLQAEQAKSVMPGLITTKQVGIAGEGDKTAFEFGGIPFKDNAPQQDFGDYLEFYQMLDEYQKVTGTQPISDYQKMQVSLEFAPRLDQDSNYLEAQRLGPQAAQIYKQNAMLNHMEMADLYMQRQNTQTTQSIPSPPGVTSTEQAFAAALPSQQASDKAFAAATLAQGKRTTPAEAYHYIRDPGTGQISTIPKNKVQQAVQVGYEDLGEAK